MHICFLNLEKGFHRLKREEMWKSLRQFTLALKVMYENGKRNMKRENMKREKMKREKIKRDS